MKLLTLPAALLVLAGPAFAAPGDPPAPSDRPSRTSNAAASSAAPRGLMRYDTNKDGAVDRAEWKAGQEARFKQLDTNGDGKLTQEELFARTPADGNSVLPSDRQAQRQTTYFQLLDADKDGFVSLAEFMVQADRNFTRCDVNKDGRIDTAECRQALQRNRPDRAARAQQPAQ
ncbi:MAG: EF-hand domain-containing protein [Alphaproteobacteria bacterium]|nr:EF-hand domain-containing protein [Alphaproteobacteria bacterium]